MLKLEWDGLAYGLLALTTIASITGLATRLCKWLLPVPDEFSVGEQHLDSRDVLSDLITSWEIIPSLLAGKLLGPHFRSQDVPNDARSRRRILVIFFIVALTTVGAETALILSTGTLRSNLRVPDVVHFTFLGRHLVEGTLLPINETVSTEDGCISAGEKVFRDRRFVEYVESLCVRKTLKRNKTMSNFVLRTEMNKFDNLGLWLGEVVKETNKSKGKQFDKDTFAIASGRVSRRVVFPSRRHKRILDKQTAIRMARVVQEKSGCVMTDARELGTLDNERLERPSNIANFTCSRPFSTTEILHMMSLAVLQGFGKYPYQGRSPRFRIPEDVEVIELQRARKVGVQLSKAYEPAWFGVMSAITLLGAIVWVVDRLRCGAVYPSVGLLSLLTDIEGLDESGVNEIYRTPVAHYHPGMTQPNGMVQRSFLESILACPAHSDDNIHGLNGRDNQDTVVPVVHPPSRVWNGHRQFPSDLDNLFPSFPCHASMNREGDQSKS